MFLHKSVIPEIKMMWYGKARITFNIILEVLLQKFNRVDTLKYQRQNIVWNPGGSKSSGFVAVALLHKSNRPHRQESMETSVHGESHAGASYLIFIT